ncbi:MAG: M20/M25/M40 family metallo-hydrolase [Albidovulum sp.]|nr:M20/M25/M40 family metallo-hydrolase [Albidovulum sp.]MDE0304922.1 M20/M25/M40 family metallo-hydrolase [Albidovulum sp.]MDE0530189.1 M20/M25/M40 family metallo-hydrolase [Albidovulum sp.]
MSGIDAKNSLDLLNSLVRVQKGGEAAVQSYIANFLNDVGCHVEQVEYEPSKTQRVDDFGSFGDAVSEKKSIVAGRLGGSSNLPSLVVFAHPDTEPVNGLDRWIGDPFTARSQDGRLYGWGVADDLAGCAAGMAAISAISSSNGRFGDIEFVSAPSKSFARGIVEFLKTKHTDACLYLHPAESGNGMKEIKAVSSGQLEFEIRVPGMPPETSEPSQTAFSHLGRNPVDSALKLYGSLIQLGESRRSRVRYPLIEKRVGRPTNLHVSKIRSGKERALSRISDHCIVGGAISFPPGERIEEVMRELELAIRRFDEEDEWRSMNPASLNWVSGSNGVEIKKSHPLYKITRQAIENVAGKAPSVNPMHTASDIRFPIVLRSIPCVGFGCLAGNLAQNGLANEWIDIESYLQMTNAALNVVEAWASGEQGASKTPTRSRLGNSPSFRRSGR